MMRIIDNFIKDPYAVREVALKQTNYAPDEQFKWPGSRTQVLDPYRKIYAECYQKYFDQSANLGWMYFQSINNSFSQGAFHADIGCKYTVITYLNLKCPLNTGTEVVGDTYHVHDQYLKKFNVDKRGFISSKKNPIDTLVYNRRVKRHNSRFTDPCIISNKFNRTLIFYGERIHRAQNFFGTNLANSRLTLIAFFD